MVKSFLEAEVKDIGRVYRVDAPFDEALNQLRAEGIEFPITARDLAYSRMQKRRTHSLNKNGSYAREGFLYAKDSPVLLSLNSPLLDLELAKQAVQANRMGTYFSTEDTQIYDQAMAQAEKDRNKEPEKRRVLILPSRNNFSISKTENFEVLQGLFKDQAEKYLEFNIQNVPVYLVEKNQVVNKGTLLTQLWFGSLDYWSVLDGDGRNLYCYSRVRGVKNSTEGAQKN